MCQIVSTLTQRGPVTVPVEVQRLLGVGPYERIAFSIVDGEVKLTKPRYSVQSLKGVLVLPPHVRDVDEILRAAKDERARRALDKLRE
ncbi:MAG: hypothetical protein ACKVVP_23215 [Chloroflexota bacterium]